MKNLVRKILLGTFMLSSVLMSNVSATVETIEADGEYHLGDSENISVGREKAKEDALRNASMKGGTFIRSEMKSVDNILTEDEIVLITSSIVKLQDSKIKNDTTSDAESIVIRCHVIVLVDSDSFERILKDPELLRQILQDTKQVADERARLQKEVEYWKNKYETAVNDSEREKAVQEIRNNENSFTATQYFERGNKLSSDKKYYEAIVEYNKAIELNPNFSDAYLNRGLTYYRLKKYSAAIRDYNKTLEIDPNYSIAYNNLGIVHADFKQYNEAIRDYTRAVEIDPKFVLAYNNRGYAHRILKQYDDAIQDYNRIIEIDQNFSWAYFNRGITYNDLQRYDEAIQDYSKAIEIDPNYTNAYLNRGLVFNNLKLYDEAILDYSKVIELDPKYSMAYNNRGYAYYLLGRYNEAAADYQKAVELDPNNQYARNNLAYLQNELRK